MRRGEESDVIRGSQENERGSVVGMALPAIVRKWWRRTY